MAANASPSYLEPTGPGRSLSGTNRAPSMPELKEDQVLSGEVLTNGINELSQQHAGDGLKRPASGWCVPTRR